MNARTRRRRRKAVAPAGEIVSALLEGYHVIEDIRRHRVLIEWGDIVGPRIATRTWPTPVHDGLLRIRVSNSSWLHQLSFLREDLRTTVNRYLGDPPLVREVRLFLGAPRYHGRDQSVLPPLLHRRRRRRRKPLPPPATGARLAAIEAETAAAIDDDELRALVRETRRRLDT